MAWKNFYEELPPGEWHKYGLERTVQSVYVRTLRNGSTYADTLDRQFPEEWCAVQTIPNKVQPFISAAAHMALEAAMQAMPDDRRL